jgi:hypothetical protein
MAQRPYVHASTIRTDSITAPDGATIEHRYRAIPVSGASVGMYKGMASTGYASNYQHRETYWVEAVVSRVGGGVAKRQCWRFSGKDAADRANHAYREVIRGLAECWPNASASFPTAQVA